MENQKAPAIIATDLSAALDMVDHSILFKVLNKRYGINGSAHISDQICVKWSLVKHPQKKRT